jgi:hypothetical protein
VYLSSWGGRRPLAGLILLAFPVVSFVSHKPRHSKNVFKSFQPGKATRRGESIPEPYPESPSMGQAIHIRLDSFWGSPFQCHRLQRRIPDAKEAIAFGVPLAQAAT